MAISSFGMGFAMGYGAGFFTREALPLTIEILRPVSRVTLKAAVRTFEMSREAVSKLGETAEDIIAEVKHELKKRKSPKKRVKTKPVSTTRIERVA